MRLASRSRLIPIGTWAIRLDLDRIAKSPRCHIWPAAERPRNLSKPGPRLLAASSNTEGGIGAEPPNAVMKGGETEHEVAGVLNRFRGPEVGA